MLDPTRLHVFCDFDGTITTPDTLRCLTEHVGAGVAFYEETNRLLWAGELTLREGVERDMRSIRVPFGEAAAVLRAKVTVDPAFRDLVAWCRMRAVPLTILSAGFHEIVQLLLPAADFPGLHVLANRFRPGSWECDFYDDSPLGHDKAVAIRAAQARGRAAVFVGDGISDCEGAAVADLVFAKRERQLLRWCRAEGIAHQEYDSFADVLRVLDARVSEGRPR